jgi:peptidoglycan/LPS O-acetylase OafA/YrhL
MSLCIPAGQARLGACADLLHHVPHAAKKGIAPRFLADSRPLVLAGRASFALYFWHMLVLVLAARLFPGPSEQLWFAALVFAVALGWSFAFRSFVEEPARSLVLRIVKTRDAGR